MKETIKRIINKLKNKDKLLHFIVNLIVVLSIGWINLPLAIGLAVGLSVGKEYSKTLSIIKTAFEEIHLLFFYYHCKQKSLRFYSYSCEKCIINFKFLLWYGDSIYGV